MRVQETGNSNFSETSQASRRSYPRWRHRFAVRYGIAEELAIGSGYEISEGGVLFTGARYYPDGTEVELHLLPDGPEGKWIVTRAIIRHANPEKMGAEFLGLGATERIKLLQSIRVP